MKTPSISICIPAYKRLSYLQRLLSSIAIQTFKDYEVIVTDDSPDGGVEEFVKNFTGITFLYYYKNQEPLGTPENWNEAIRKANGTWVKLMHDDDWFADENSLQQFYNATVRHPDCEFFFSAYCNVDSEKKFQRSVSLNWLGRFLLKQSPFNLFKKQYIGNPSCTLIKREINLFYDNRLKWVVDFEYYIRCLMQTITFHYIPQTLVNIGVNEDQVTQYTFRNPEIEIPENHLMLKKFGSGILRNIFVYDYYWRMYRNLGIRDELQIIEFDKNPLPPIIKNMIGFQKRFSLSFLKKGMLSKMAMMVAYLVNFFRRK